MLEKVLTLEIGCTKCILLGAFGGAIHALRLLARGGDVRGRP
jgi:hypothetical protein